MSQDPSPAVPSSIVARLRGFVEANQVPLAVFAVSRAGLFLLAYLALVLMPMGERPWRAFPHNLFLDGWLRWDSEWYLRIAAEGYTNVAQSGWQAGQRDTAFFPLYPLLIRAVGVFTGGPLIAGLLVSNVAFLAALLLLYRLVTDRYDTAVATRTLVLVAVYPFSFFFGAMYTESLFLLAAVAAFFFGERDRWAAASLSAAAAGATRVVGLGVTLGILLLYLERARRSGQGIRRNVLWLALGPTGTLGYMAFLAIRFRDPLQFVEHQFAGWGKAGGNSLLETVAQVLSPTALASGRYPAMPAVHLLVTLLAAGLLAAAWRRLPLPLSAWAAITLLLSLSLWSGMGRFLAVVFPLFIGGALLLPDDRRFLAVAYVCTLFLALFTIVFARFIWVA